MSRFHSARPSGCALSYYPCTLFSDTTLSMFIDSKVPYESVTVSFPLMIVLANELKEASTLLIVNITSAVVWTSS